MFYIFRLNGLAILIAPDREQQDGKGKKN